MEQCSSDSGTEIFITVSISHALIALYLSDGKTGEEKQTKAGIKRENEGERKIKMNINTLQSSADIYILWCMF